MKVFRYMISSSSSSLRASCQLARVCCVALAIGTGQVALADSIPYPDAGTYDPNTFTFSAGITGELIAYFTGRGAAGDDDQLGLLANGTLQGGFGLDNQTSSIGDAYNFGSVQAGSTLVFVLHNITLGAFAYSDAAMNAAFDDPGETLGHNHIYSTPYTATDPILGDPGVIPFGQYVGFEDLPFPGSDFSYTDETFVVAIASVPEPPTFVLAILATLVVGLTSSLGADRVGCEPGSRQSKQAEFQAQLRAPANTRPESAPGLACISESHRTATLKSATGEDRECIQSKRKSQ